METTIIQLLLHFEREINRCRESVQQLSADYLQAMHSGNHTGMHRLRPALIMALQQLESLLTDYMRLSVKLEPTTSQALHTMGICFKKDEGRYYISDQV